MTTDTDLVVVRRSYLDFLRSHCDRCLKLSVQQRDFLRENDVDATPLSEIVRKRKTTPRSPSDDISKHLKPLKGQNKTLRARDGFLRNIPEAGQWRTKQDDIVGGAKNYEKIVRSLTRYSKVDATESTQKVLKSNEHLVLIGEKLALLTDASLRIAALQKSFSYFQVLLFLLYCGLLESR